MRMMMDSKDNIKEIFDSIIMIILNPIFNDAEPGRTKISSINGNLYKSSRVFDTCHGEFRFKFLIFVTFFFFCKQRVNIVH